MLLGVARVDIGAADVAVVVLAVDAVVLAVDAVVLAVGRAPARPRMLSMSMVNTLVSS